MCDYSLHALATRDARVGETLVSTKFHLTTTRGFSGVSDPEMAVCLRPGTEIAFKQGVLVEGMMFRKKIGDQWDLERKLMNALEQRAREVRNYISELRSLHGEIDAEQDARIRRVNRQAALADEPTWRQIFSRCSWGPEYLEQHGAEVDEMDELDRKHAAERMAA